MCITHVLLLCYKIPFSKNDVFRSTPIVSPAFYIDIYVALKKIFNFRMIQKFTMEVIIFKLSYETKYVQLFFCKFIMTHFFISKFTET